MASLSPAILGLRRNERLLKVPPYLSAFCIIVGVAWLLLLPLNEYSRKTYVSENAILPGQVHTYFGGSEHNIFRAYRHEVASLADKSNTECTEKLGEVFRSHGLKVAKQQYKYHSAGKNITGENVYAILRGPRADATEAIVLVGAWRNMDGVLNQSGVALVLTLARYFKRWSLWSKDIIFLVTADSMAGPQAWVDAYHNAHDPLKVDSLPLKSGALQGAVAVDYPAGPWGHRFEKLHIVYDGINGQLPNLDLFNTAVNIAQGQMGIDVAIQQMWKHDDSYQQRLQTMLRGMLVQGIGYASGPHSSFIPYHVDAITLQTVGDGWHDEMSLGRTVESIFRSLNNLLEHLHQSFFFYLLMQPSRFVSIGTYLPSAMLIAVNFTITAIALWVQSGRPDMAKQPDATTDEKAEKDVTVVKTDDAVAIVPTETLIIAERRLFLPVVFVSLAHLLGIIPLYLLNHTTDSYMTAAHLFAKYFHCGALPFIAAVTFGRIIKTRQEWVLISCFSLVLLGMFLSALATLNFSLAFLVGLSAVPLSFVRQLGHMKSRTLKMVITGLSLVVLTSVSPSMVMWAACKYWGRSVDDMLAQAAFGWHVSGMWTQVVVWLVWWPAWFSGMVVVATSWRQGR